MNVWDVIEANLQIDGNYVGLYGPPGTGKTYAAARYGVGDGAVVEVDAAEKTVEMSEDGVVLFSMTMTDGASEAELRGHFIPTATGGAWIDGPASMAWKMSHSIKTRLVINEIDRASDEVLSLLYAIADDPTSPGTMLTLPNESKEKIRPGKHFTVVATMNGVPEDLPEALQDRFAWIHVNEINPEAVAALPDHLRSHATNSALAGGDRRISIRKWLKYANLLANEMTPQMAAYTAFGADRYQDVLDSVGVAAVVARTAAFSPPASTIRNPSYDKRFTSFEMIEKYDEDGDVDDYWCGWCQEPSCGNEDQECTPMRFVDQREWEDFCAAYSLSTADTPPAAQVVWAASMLHRTHSRELTQQGISDLTEINFGTRIYPS